MPKPIGYAHNHFIERYFETAKSNVIDKKLPHLASTSQGYLKPIRMLIKVYPNLKDKIMFISLL